MVFYFLISIVFIAELIIFAAILINLIKLDKFFIRSNNFLDEAKPKIKSIFELAHGISDQIAELIPIWIKNLKDKRDRLLQKQLERLISGILFWSINIKVLKKVKKSKFARAVLKGLNLAQSVLY